MMMRAGSAAVLFSTVLTGASGLQRAGTPVVEIQPYPGSVKFCSEHVTGAPRDGASGAHINWTGYHSTDPPEKVVAHYKKLLGTASHLKQNDQDVWRFPSLERPERALSVTHPQGPFPRGTCSNPPDAARTIVIISTSTR